MHFMTSNAYLRVVHMRFMHLLNPGIERFWLFSTGFLGPIDVFFSLARKPDQAFACQMITQIGKDNI